VYWGCRLAAHLALRVIYRLTIAGAGNAPRSGPLLVVSNHQSHLDAPAIGVAFRRTDVVYLARRSLFRVRPFAWLIRTLNAIPIEDDRGDLGAIRAALGALRDGRAVLVFPEGSRTADGALAPFKRGAWLLLSRAHCPVLPVAVEGAFDAWPRGRALPRLWGCRISIAIGPPIPHERLAAMTADDGLAYLAATVDALRLAARADLRRATRGRYPRAGPGDRGLDSTASGTVRRPRNQG
jgi:1-acyl-sn-glycerol-3-phosphate acyltransferase